MRVDAPKQLPSEHCSQCWKPAGLCVCAWVTALSNRKKVLILQHPQEAKEGLSSGRLLSLSLKNCAHRVGLSWASLEHALGERAENSRWVVLYVGSRKQSGNQKSSSKGSLWKRGKLVQNADLSQFEGVILLDGNWKQSKSLWWRNAWLNRLPRLILKPTVSSSYHVLRKQPRGECLCTMEAAAETLAVLGENPTVVTGLQERLEKFIDSARFPTHQSVAAESHVPQASV